MVPIDPKDHQAADYAARGQRDHEADPEAWELHVLLKGEIDTHRETNNVIRTNGKRCLVASVLESRFSVDSHKVKNGTGPLSTLSTQDTTHNGGQSIRKLEQGDQWENRSDKIDDLWTSLSVSELRCKQVEHTWIIVEKFSPVVPENHEHGTVWRNYQRSHDPPPEQDPYLHPIAIKKAIKNEA